MVARLVARASDFDSLSADLGQPLALGRQRLRLEPQLPAALLVGSALFFETLQIRLELDNLRIEVLGAEPSLFQQLPFDVDPDQLGGATA